MKTQRSISAHSWDFPGATGVTSRSLEHLGHTSEGLSEPDSLRPACEEPLRPRPRLAAVVRAQPSKVRAAQGRRPLSPEDLEALRPPASHHRHKPETPQGSELTPPPPPKPASVLTEGRVRKAVQAPRTASSRLKERWELGWTWTGGLPKAAKCQAGGLACPQVQEQAGTHAKGARTPLSETIGHKDTLRPPQSLRLTYPLPWAKK